MNPILQKLRRFRQAALWLGLLASLAAGAAGFCGDVSLTEYQVKALFLMNFTKYVDWPETAFAGTKAPITIGVYGKNNFGEALQNAVAGRSVNGRGILIEQMENTNDLVKCQVLFISGSEAAKQGQILDQLKAAPVLTVGESEGFTDRGGIINFVKKTGKIRLEINAQAAQEATLQISSKLLSVADVVKGIPK
ncbi:MAG: YfiR family protein [Verrucomicrobiota bacterium]|jgi:hypothetical protein